MAIKPVDHGDKGKKNYTLSATKEFIEKNVDPDCAKGMRSARMQQLMSHALEMHRLNRKSIRTMLHKIGSYDYQQRELFELLTMIYDPSACGTICTIPSESEVPSDALLGFTDENKVLLQSKYGMDWPLLRFSIGKLNEHILVDQPSAIYTIIDSVQRFHMRTALWEQGKILVQPQLEDLFKEVDNE